MLRDLRGWLFPTWYRGVGGFRMQTKMYHYAVGTFILLFPVRKNLAQQVIMMIKWMSYGKTVENRTPNGHPTRREERETRERGEREERERDVLKISKSGRVDPMDPT